MKFYFCEKCGKRLTEADIDQGAAKNKKLKGVYCTACSAGVMTMETLPLTDEMAQQILGDKPERQRDAATGQKRTALRRRSASRGVSLPGEAGKEVQGQKAELSFKVLIASACVLVVFLAVILALWLPNYRKTRTERKRRLKAEPSAITAAHGPDPSRAVQKLSLSEKGKKANPLTSPTIPTQTTTPDSGTVNLPSDPTSKSSNSTSPSPTEKSITKKPASSILPPEAPQIIVKPVKPAGPDWPAFDHHMDDLLKALAQEDWKQASLLAQQMAKDEPMDPLGAGLNSLPEGIAFLKARQETRTLKLKALVGRTLAAGPLDGKVIAFEEGVFRVEKTFYINGKPKGAAIRKVAVKDLPPAVLRRLAPQSAPATPSHHAALALQHVHEERFPVAQSELDTLGSHPLRDLVKRTLERRQGIAREKWAKNQWEALQVRVGSIQNSNQKAARAALRELDALKQTYTKTACLKEIASELSLVQRQLESIAFPFEHLVRTRFKGKVTVLDARQARIKVEYDLQKKEQLLDLLLEPQKRLTEGKDLKVLGLGRPCVLISKAFDVRDLVLEFSYSYISYGGRNSVSIYLGIPSSRDDRDETIRITLGSYKTKGGLVSERSTYYGQKTMNRFFTSSDIASTKSIRVETRPGGISFIQKSKEIGSHDLKDWPHISGLGIGCTSTFGPTRLLVTGRLAPDWLRKAMLEEQKGSQ